MLPSGRMDNRLRRAFDGWSGPAWGVVAVIVALLLSSACGGGDATGNVRGIIVEVIGRDIAEIETLSIRSEDGKTWTFTTEGPLRFSAAHLRDHQISGQTVLVVYTPRGDGLVAVELRD